MKFRRIAVPTALLVAILAACGGGSSPSAEPTTSSAMVNAETTVVDSTPDGPTTTVSDDVAKIRVTVGVDSGPERVENVKLNQQVELTIVNPKADDEFHLHGYDLGGGTTKAGEEKTFVFTATEAGDFEVESHVSETVLVVLHIS